MPSLIRNEDVSEVTPSLLFYAVRNGRLAELHSLEYVVENSDGAQVFPEGDEDERQVVDVEVARLGVGVYYAQNFVVPDDAAFERHTIRWFYRFEDGGTEFKHADDFDVVDAPMGGIGYALPSDFRAEGWSAADVGDARLVHLIERESTRIDHLTGRWFEPQSITMRVDGRGSARIDFGSPIIAIASVEVNGTVLSPDSYVVYNRHMQRMFDPDDRRDPRIYYAPGFAEGRQNVTVKGIFGFTDPGGPAGRTPRLIQLATMLLVAKQVDKLNSEGHREAQIRPYITSERTRDQEYTLASVKMQNAYSLTGDSEIDDILMHFLAPLGIGHT